MGRAPRPALVAARHRAVAHLLAQQGPRGDREGETVWCPIITAQYAVVRHVVGRLLDEPARAELRRHFEVTHTAQGGWGLFFGSAMLDCHLYRSNVPAWALARPAALTSIR